MDVPAILRDSPVLSAGAGQLHNGEATINLVGLPKVMNAAVFNGGADIMRVRCRAWTGPNGVGSGDFCYLPNNFNDRNVKVGETDAGSYYGFSDHELMTPPLPALSWSLELSTSIFGDSGVYEYKIFGQRTGSGSAPVDLFCPADPLWPYTPLSTNTSRGALAHRRTLGGFRGAR